MMGTLVVKRLRMSPQRPAHLAQIIEKKDRKAIPPEQRLVITLRFLQSGEL